MPRTDAQSTARVLLPVAKASIDDQRAAFRQVFCHLLADSPGNDSACDTLLLRLGDEPAAADPLAVPLVDLPDIHVMVVPGFGWDCLQQLFDPTAMPSHWLEALGIGVTRVTVEGLSSSERNAVLIRRALRAHVRATPQQKLLLVGYSKGVTDILVALSGDPALAHRVDGVISLAGSVGGSPLATELPEAAMALTRALPGARCSGDDGGALQSLTPDERQRWLAHHGLPSRVPFYSVVSYPQASNVSLILKAGHRRLARIDPRNDGSLLPYDQIVPGSALLGYVNADHVAIALPSTASHPVLGGQLLNHNEFPRNLLWEAVIRYVAHDLAGTDQAGK